MTPSLGLINLLEWLTELRKSHLPPRLPVYYKRILKDLAQHPDEQIYRATSYSISNPSPFPWKSGGETKFQPSNHIVGSLGNQPPPLGGIQKSPSLKCF